MATQLDQGDWNDDAPISARMRHEHAVPKGQ
jgi:hypothetical protein